jgi:predicted nucleic acid-binding protein
MEAFFNTSPVIFLEKLGLLDKLLPKLWSEIYLTEAVINEIDDNRITERPYFKRYVVEDKIAVMAMPSALHRGEIESIIGAIETRVNFLVIDDFKARKKARSLGIETVGTIGVILLSFENGIISIEEAVRYLYELRKHSFWIDEGLFEEAIRRLSE